MTIPGPTANRRTGDSALRGDSVSIREKIALGAGGLPLFLGLSAIGSFAMPFYQMTLNLDPVWLGVALTIPRLMDAFIDPLVGRFSDNFRSRFGRRRPLIAAGALVQALTFGLIWMAPLDLGQAALTAWLIITQIVFYFGYSLFSVPLLALQYEITPDYDERTSVSSYVGFFGKLGELGYNYIFPIASSAMFVSVISGVRSVGWIVGVVFLGLLGLIPAIFVRERLASRVRMQEKVELLPGIRAAFGNRAFRVLVALTILQIVAGMLTSSVDRYLIVYYLFAGDVALGETWKGNISAAYAIVGIIAIFPVSWLARKVGKAKTVAIAFGLTLVGAIARWFLFTPGNPYKILLDPLFCGPVWIAINVLTPAMLADICDEDELSGHVRREGLFGAIFSWVQKVGYSCAFFGAFISLKLSGFDAALGGNQSPETILSLRLILTATTAIWAITALVILRTYPLSRHRAHEIRRELDDRRLGR